ncbi:MAG: lipoprotein [Nevskia sp.]|nr:lipoprotein [Nevskia sp.]
MRCGTLILALLLAACGASGALYLPDQQPDKVAANRKEHKAAAPAPAVPAEPPAAPAPPAPTP